MIQTSFFFFVHLELLEHGPVAKSTALQILWLRDPET